MKSQIQQPEYVDTTSPEVIEASEPASLTKLPPVDKSDQQWRQIGAQVAKFLAQLPDYLGRFFNTYRQPIVSVALIMAAIISLKVVLAIIDALNDIPLLSPTFQLIGIGYCVWFVNRYLLKTSNRQELLGQLQSLKQEVISS